MQNRKTNHRWHPRFIVRQTASGLHPKRNDSAYRPGISLDLFDSQSVFLCVLAWVGRPGLCHPRWVTIEAATSKGRRAVRAGPS